MILPNNALSFMGLLVSKQKGILERLLASQPNGNALTTAAILDAKLPVRSEVKADNNNYILL